MTATREHVIRERARRTYRRGWWSDSLTGSVWIVTAIAIAFFIESGGLLALNWYDHFYGLGRATGIVAAVLVLTQVLLISRAPFLERVVGHDRATLLHTTLGKIAFLLMLVHVGLITGMSAFYESNSLLEQSQVFWSIGWYMVTAQAAFGLFAIVVATSLMIVRSRWRYETWYYVHLTVYIAIALVVPHQFLEGSTFRFGGAAWWFWLVLYVFAFGSLILYRFIRPVFLTLRHQLRVQSVENISDGSTQIVMTGRNLERLHAKAGQFFIWRFLDKERWREAHPFSLSHEPDGSALRITVKPIGDMTKDLSSLKPGTRVIADGPLGVFTKVTQHRPGVVMMAAGIGITPIRSMLEAHTEADGPCTVIYRVRSVDEAPLLEEVKQLAHEREAILHVLVGEPGKGWAPAGSDMTLADIAEDVASCDLYICGPPAWADIVEDDARAAGVNPEDIHREKFAW